MIKNFIEFATNRIHPDVFSKYKDNNYTDGDFTGSDESTLDFTKLGWMMSVRDSMKKGGTWTEDVDSLVNELFVMDITDESGTLPNYKAVSNGNFNLLQQLVYDNRNNGSFDLDYSYITDFKEKTSEMLYYKFDDTQMSAAEMIVEFGLNNAAKELELSKIGSKSTESIASKRFSTYMFAYQKAASSLLANPEVTSSSEKLLNVFWNKMEADGGTSISYNDFYFRNPVSHAEAMYPKNEISRMISYLSHDMVEAVVPEIIKDLTALGADNEEDMEALVNVIKKSVKGSIGLAASSVKFDPSNYLTMVDSLELNKGYTPLFFYIAKFGGECRKTVLDELSKKFCPVSIVLTTGNPEGFTPLGMLAYEMEIDGDSWKNEEAAAFIKEQTLDFVNMDNVYEALAAMGSVRDFSGGKSNNSFGVINNLFFKINADHKLWWANESADENSTKTIDDYEETFNSLISLVFGGDTVTYSIYKIWMFEYGKEIS